jgi:FkbM family methyltransferase
VSENSAIKLCPYTSITDPSPEGIDNLFRSVLDTDTELFPRKADKPVILYGAGNLGKMAKNFFTHLNLPFLYVVDKNASQYRADAFWKGIRVIHPDDVASDDKKNALLVICIVTMPLIKLRDDLLAAGWEDIAFFYDVSEAYCDCHPLSNGWFINKLSSGEKESIKKVYSFLTDDTSRLHYLQFIAWRRMRIELLLKDVVIDGSNRFFITEITNCIKDNETFIDCGAHKGTVTEKFITIVNGNYQEIYAIEPDEINFGILLSRLGEYTHIKLLQSALSDSNYSGTFCEGFDYASKLSEHGSTMVNAITLDSLNIPATFIKMHLEGGELKALRGATRTIQKHRPVLAVTLYHSSDGAWEIPLYLISNLK